jgi:histidinol-phosphate aminotransferase
MLGALKSDQSIKIVMICSPGNPTGTMINRKDIQALLECNFYKGVVVVDEAYIDFCQDVNNDPPSVAAWVLKYPNLIVSQTLSKAFGLAAIRLGFTISSKEIAKIFNATKAPYNISTLTSELAQTALGDGLVVMKKNIALINDERSKLMELISNLPFISRLLGNHDANFILAQVVDKNGNPDNDLALFIYKKLAEKEKIVVRFRGNELGCLACLRITVGTACENTELIDKLKSIME